VVRAHFGVDKGIVNEEKAWMISLCPLNDANVLHRMLSPVRLDGYLDENLRPYAFFSAAMKSS